MGQLKTGIANLSKVMMESEPKIKAVQDTLDKNSDRVTDLCMKCDQGYDVMYLYLIAKFKKTGSTPEAQANKTLKEIMDSALAQNIKGILQWIQDIKAQVAKLNAAQQESTAGLLTTLKNAEAQAIQLKAIAAKKKDKWFKSAKYKDKIKTYLAVLDGLQASLKKAKDGVTAAQSLRFTDSWVDKNMGITPDMTVAQVKNRASMDLHSVLQNYEKNKDEINGRVRKLRDEYKSIPGQLAALKKWEAEADAMEAES